MDLSELTGTTGRLPPTAIRATLLAGSRTRMRHGRSLFAFRLHQFISKGGSVYATAEPSGTRDDRHGLPGGPSRDPGAAAVPAGVLPGVRPGVPDGHPDRGQEGIGHLDARHGMSRLTRTQPTGTCTCRMPTLAQ